MIKREVKRQLQRYGRYFDIVLSLVLVCLLVVPILSVLNLSPKQAPDLEAPTENKVLGVETYEGDVLQLKLVGGKHNYIQNEELYQYEEGSFIYSTRIQARDMGIYSKPILKLNVPEGQKVEVKFSIAKVENSTSQIGITKDKRNYILRAEDGQQFIRDFEFARSGSYELSLDIRNDADVNFPENIDLHIYVSPLEGDAL